MSDSAATPTPAAPSIVVDHARYYYPPTNNVKSESVVCGITDAHLTVYPGERILLLGANGSGKSTLLALLAGKHRAASGRVTVLARDAFDDTSLNRDVGLIASPWPTDATFACTVEAIASPPRDVARRDDLARRIHLPLRARVDHMSTGERRRVQILHALMDPRQVILLDECSTDVDVAERVTVMNYVRDECQRAGACCVYATHILDGVEDWATRVLLMEEGRIVRDEPFSQSFGDGANAAEVARRWVSKDPSLTFAQLVKQPLLAAAQPSADAAAAVTTSPSVASAGAAAPTPVIVCKNLTYRNILSNVSFTINAGSRVLLLGCNGCGKTTLLELMGGIRFFPNRGPDLTINGRPSFHDTRLGDTIAFGGNWWTDIPQVEVHVREMVTLPFDARAERLCELLRVNLDWDIRHVSSGECKRVLLLLRLQHQRAVVFLDEATADLDVDMRVALLAFLYEESAHRGVTVVYTTHIFEGLEGWASHLMVLDRTAKGLHMLREEAHNITKRELIETLVALKEREQWDL